MDVYTKLVDAEQTELAALSKNRRLDGRKFAEFRGLSIQVGVLSRERTAESVEHSSSSSMVKKSGGTTVVCAAAAELAEPPVDKPKSGMIRVAVRHGDAADESSIELAVLGQMLNELLRSETLISRSDLSISENRLCWLVSCDLLVVESSGSLLDADVAAVSLLDSALCALICALRSLRLPNIIVDEEKFTSLKAGKNSGISVDFNNIKAVPLKDTPAACLFSFYSTVADQEEQKTEILVDPTAAELTALQCHLVVVAGGNGCIYAVSSGNNSTAAHNVSSVGVEPEKHFDKCIILAKKRQTELEEAMESVVSQRRPVQQGEND